MKILVILLKTIQPETKMILGSYFSDTQTYISRSVAKRSLAKFKHNINTGSIFKINYNKKRIKKCTYSTKTTKSAVIVKRVVYREQITSQMMTTA